MKRMLSIVIYGIALLLICDSILAQGGYRTIISRYHPLFVYLSLASVPGMILWLVYKAYAAFRIHLHRRGLIIIVCIISLIIGTRIIIPSLAERSEKKAYDLLKVFLAGQRDTFTVDIEKDVEEDFQDFLVTGDYSSIRLISSSPQYGNYIYSIETKTSAPFHLSLFVSDDDKGGRIWIFRLKGNQT